MPVANAKPPSTPIIASSLKPRLPIVADAKCYPPMLRGNQRMNFFLFVEICANKVHLRKV
jgi:hypothetical protein